MSAFIKQYCTLHGYAPLVPSTLSPDEIDTLWFQLLEDLGYWA